jgi:hypothetical protein
MDETKAEVMSNVDLHRLVDNGMRLEFLGLFIESAPYEGNPRNNDLGFQGSMARDQVRSDVLRKASEAGAMYLVQTRVSNHRGDGEPHGVMSVEFIGYRTI